MEAVLDEVENAIEDCEGEVQRVQEIERRLLMDSQFGAECAGCHEEGKLSNTLCANVQQFFHRWKVFAVLMPLQKASQLPHWDCTPNWKVL